MEEIRIKVEPGTIHIKNGTCPNGCALENPKKLIYGVFDYESDLELQEGDIVGLYCPHCNAFLTASAQCALCRVPMFAIHLPKGGEVHSCPTVGCKNHVLTIVDLDDQFALFYNEERRPKI